MTTYDFAGDLLNIVDARWDGTIITKPTLTKARDVRKIRRNHIATTIYFFEHINFKPVTHWATRDFTVDVELLLIGLTHGNINNMARGSAQNDLFRDCLN